MAGILTVFALFDMLLIATDIARSNTPAIAIPITILVALVLPGLIGRKVYVKHHNTDQTAVITLATAALFAFLLLITFAAIGIQAPMPN